MVKRLLIFISVTQINVTTKLWRPKQTARLSLMLHQLLGNVENMTAGQTTCRSRDVTLFHVSISFLKISCYSKDKDRRPNMTYF